MPDTIRFEVSGTLARIARLHDEWFSDVGDPENVIAELKAGSAGKVDLFTFWRRPGTPARAFGYHCEPEFVAALPVTSYESWWNNQIDGKTRNLVRKGQKKALAVEVVPFDDRLVEGITKIFNETPVRQGRRFWHYGKNFDRVRTEMSDRLPRRSSSAPMPARELVGFVKLLLLREYAMMVEIISEVRHRDKAPNNSLIAAAVRECARRQIPMLTYSTWGPSSLGLFQGAQRIREAGTSTLLRTADGQGAARSEAAATSRSQGPPAGAVRREAQSRKKPVLRPDPEGLMLAA